MKVKSPRHLFMHPFIPQSIVFLSPGQCQTQCWEVGTERSGPGPFSRRPAWRRHKQAIGISDGWFQATGNPTAQRASLSRTRSEGGAPRRGVSGGNPRNRCRGCRAALQTDHARRVIPEESLAPAKARRCQVFGNCLEAQGKWRQAWEGQVGYPRSLHYLAKIWTSPGTQQGTNEA